MILNCPRCKQLVVAEQAHICPPVLTPPPPNAHSLADWQELYNKIARLERLRARQHTNLAIFSLALLLSLLANFGMILLLVEKSK